MIRTARLAVLLVCAFSPSSCAQRSEPKLLPGAAEPSTRTKLPTACRWACYTPFGNPLGRNSGVVAFSNCSSRCIANQPASTSPPTAARDGAKAASAGADRARSIYTGMKWQCVEYARRWWIAQYGATFGSVDTAAAMWQQVDSARSTAGRGPLPVVAHANGSADPPRVGDLLIYRANPQRAELRFGHVAVVVGVEANEVAVAEQNFDNRPWHAPRAHARLLTLRRKEGPSYWVVDSMACGADDCAQSIYGWLRLSPGADAPGTPR